MEDEDYNDNIDIEEDYNDYNDYEIKNDDVVDEIENLFNLMIINLNYKLFLIFK